MKIKYINFKKKKELISFFLDNIKKKLINYKNSFLLFSIILYNIFSPSIDIPLLTSNAIHTLVANDIPLF